MYVRGSREQAAVEANSADEISNVFPLEKLPAQSLNHVHRRRVQRPHRPNDKSDTLIAHQSLLAIDYPKSNELITK